jgi:hypothetical protein
MIANKYTKKNSNKKRKSLFIIEKDIPFFLRNIRPATMLTQLHTYTLFGTASVTLLQLNPGWH